MIAGFLPVSDVAALQATCTHLHDACGHAMTQARREVGMKVRHHLETTNRLPTRTQLGIDIPKRQHNEEHSDLGVFGVGVAWGRVGHGMGPGYSNTMFGNDAGRSFCTGSNNTFCGFFTCPSVTTCSNCSIHGALSDVHDGASNVSLIGFDTHVDGSQNSVMGASCGIIGSKNTVQGCGNIVVGHHNIVIGNHIAVVGSFNIVFGQHLEVLADYKTSFVQLNN